MQTSWLFRTCTVSGAKKFEKHEDYLRIQIEDTGDFIDALMYMKKLGPEVV